MCILVNNPTHYSQVESIKPCSCVCINLFPRKNMLLSTKRSKEVLCTDDNRQGWNKKSPPINRGG